MIDLKENKSWIFLFSIIFIYIVIALFNTGIIKKSLNKFISILGNIYYIFILVFLLMAVFNYFIKPKAIVKHLGKDSGIKAWIFAIVGGIISTGPIYMWYPLLSDLQKHGTRAAYIATFLYNRAIKIPLLPVIVLYFSLKYAIVLTIVMIIISIIQGIIIEKIMEAKKYENSNSISKR